MTTVTKKSTFFRTKQNMSQVFLSPRTNILMTLEKKSYESQLLLIARQIVKPSCYMSLYITDETSKNEFR